MKSILALALAIILSPLAISLFTADAQASDEPMVERKVNVVLKADDGEAVKLDLSDLEVGDTTQMTTDSGKLVVITRDDEGYLVDIEGKEIRIGTGDGIQVHADGDGDHHVMVKVLSSDKSDGEHDVRIDKRIVVSSDGKEINIGEHGIKVLRLGDDADGLVKVLTDFDCEGEDEEECIEGLLTGHGISIQLEGLDGEAFDLEDYADGSHKVIVIKKSESHEDHED